MYQQRHEPQHGAAAPDATGTDDRNTHMFGARSRRFFQPWWRPVVGWVGVTVVVALVYTYLPEMQRGRTFLQELRYSAILATILTVGVIVGNAVLDSWEQARSRRRGAGRDDPGQGMP